MLALSFQLELAYLDGSPRRSVRHAKVQRIETLATDTAVGIMVFAATKRDRRLRQEGAARQRAEERRRRDAVPRARHVEGRRDAALNAILEEIAALDRLRCMVVGLRGRGVEENDARLAELLTFAEHRLDIQEAALSGNGLASRLEKQRIIGEDDDHEFKPRYCY